MPLVKQLPLGMILLSLLMFWVFPSDIQAESMRQWSINMQDEADAYARWLDHPPKNRNLHDDALVVRKFIYTCTMLKAYSSNDWCGSSSLTMRWLGYARKHGFDSEMRGYKQTTAGDFRFPNKILKEISKSLRKKKR